MKGIHQSHAPAEKFFDFDGRFENTSRSDKYFTLLYNPTQAGNSGA